MLFMVIENFKKGDAVAVGKRFKASGRMFPEGVSYQQASWVDPDGMRCFQVMEAQDRELLNSWIPGWDDLIDFETRSGRIVC